MAGTSNSGGRNKKSGQAHVLNGTFRDDRHEIADVPQAPVGTPVSPKPLEGDAAEEWDRMIVRLSELGTLSTVDDAVLYQYCQLFAETERILVTQLETGASVDILEENLAGLKGPDLVAAFQEISKLRALESRYGSQIRQGRMSVRQYLVELGMTPSARSRVKAPAQKPSIDPAKAKYGSIAR